jgi:hypothetical protein
MNPPGVIGRSIAICCASARTTGVPVTTLPWPYVCGAYPLRVADTMYDPGGRSVTA